jgi:hypothetical protein
MTKKERKENMKKLLFVILSLFAVVAYADNTITSKEYVDGQVSNLQTQIPAKNTNTVLTNTGTAGTVGEKAIYDTSVAYGTQSDALVTAGAFNSAVQNALESEFVCVEWQGNVHDNAHCLLYEVRGAVQTQTLPSGYTQLEYLESTGTQYIDTGVITSDNLMIDVTFQFLSTLNKGNITVLFGASNGTAQDYPTDTQIWVQDQLFNIARCYNDNDSDPVYKYRCRATEQDTNKHRVIFNNHDGGVWWDNTKIGDFLPYTSNGKVMYIGSSNHPNRLGYMFGTRRTYKVIFTNKTTGQKVRDFIPARRDRDGELGMYDLVSSTFFTNSGTGEFIAGPVVYF